MIPGRKTIPLVQMRKSIDVVKEMWCCKSQKGRQNFGLTGCIGTRFPEGKRGAAAAAAADTDIVGGIAGIVDM